jgi:thioredoxin-dependent peroxiredoxin
MAKKALKKGNKAPKFKAEATSGDVSLDGLSGKQTVMFFYPKDNTSGCTKEACAFRDLKPKFDKLGVNILGVSKDSIASHEKFQDKHGLNFDLISDPDKKLLEKYGAWREKKMYGKIHMGTQRMTVLIGEDGTIQKIWEKVKPAEHPQEVLDTINELKKK